jgi:hypothetical protein
VSVSSGAIRAGRAFVELGVKDAKFKKGMGDAEKRMNAFASGVAKVGAASLAMGTAVAGGLAAMSRAFANAADDLDTMATKSGMSVEALSELSLGVKQANISMDDLAGGVARMQRVIAAATNGDSGAVGALDAIGLSVESLSRMNPDDQFAAIADGIAGISDPAQRTSAAMGIFGRSGANLIPLLANGSKGLAEMRARARELGLTMTTASAKGGAQLADRLDELSMVTARATQKIGEAFAPALMMVLNATTPLIVQVGRFISQNPALVLAVGATASAAAALGAGLIAVAISAKVAAIAVGLLTSPVFLIVGGITAAALAVLYFTGTLGTVAGAIGDAFGSAFTWVSGVLESINQALSGGDMALAAEVGLAAVEIQFRRASVGILGVWDSLMGGLAKGWAYLWNTLKLTGNLAMNEISGVISALMETFAAGLELVADGLAAIGIADGSVRSLATTLQQSANRRTPDSPSAIVQRADADLARQFDAIDRNRSPSLVDAETNLAKAQERLAKAQADAFAAFYENGGSNPFGPSRATSPAIPAARAADQAVEEVFANLGPGGSRGTFATSDAALASLRGGPTAQLLERIAKVAERIQRSVDDTEPGYIIAG